MIMCRCGEQGVVLSCDGSLEMVSCREENLSFMLDGACHLVQERDCVRVISATSLELIQRVPQVVVDIFRINSTSPGSYLLEASKQFQVGFAGFKDKRYQNGRMSTSPQNPPVVFPSPSEVLGFT